MKTNAIVTIEREGKTIVIYVNNGDWSNLPDLSFIADVEVYQPERLNPEDNFDDYLKDPGKYLRRMEDNLIKEIVCDSPNPENK